jgi:DNA-3-methyladenine glycosylase
MARTWQPGSPLGPADLDRPATAVAPLLIGATIRVGPVVGIIVETEAYQGIEDRACHASRGRTPRTETLFAAPGALYVYLCYGMHIMLNLVCDAEGVPAAVLLRAVDITAGERLARRRRGAGDGRRELLANGPAKLTQALGIGLAANRLQLGARDCPLVLHAARAAPPLAVGPRVGVDYAGAWALKPWRWWRAGYPVAGPPRRG